MSTKVRIVLNVFYWLFIFAMGFLIIVFLPRAFSYTGLYEKINDAIVNDRPEEAIGLNELYYDSTPVYQLDDKSFSLFATSSKQRIDNQAVLDKQYVGIIKNVDKSRFNNQNVNKSEILINNEYKISIITIDVDEDKKYDSVSTLISYDFIYFNIPYKCVDVVNLITLKDYEGNNYLEYEVNLSFSESFFTDINPLIEEFNQNQIVIEENETKFLNINEAYKRGDIENVNFEARLKTTFVMLGYVFIALLFYDIGLGLHLTWIPVKWIYRKSMKKSSKNTSKEPVGLPKYEGNTQLKIKATVPAGFSKQIKIQYENLNKELNFEVVLRKTTEYQATLSVKASTYKLKSTYDDFVVNGLPEELVLDKFYQALTLTIDERGSSNGTNITNSSQTIYSS